MASYQWQQAKDTASPGPLEEKTDSHMSNKFDPGLIYRMPACFGPRCGPRQGPDGQKFACEDYPKATTIAVNFLSDAEQLQALLPDGFSLAGEPQVSVSASYTTEIEWLAGRGYNMLGVRIPATFRGKEDEVSGSFLSVLWENLTDPIITGRDELGVPKIWCELPEPFEENGVTRLSASWLGFRFLDLAVSDLEELDRIGIDHARQSTAGGGDLHLKYIPKTGHWGQADVCYVTHIPAATPNKKILQQWSGSGEVQFHHARWDDMPTQYNIVNALADLEIREYRGASITKTVGGKDLGDVRILT
jgi:hypothetical protein